MTTDKETNSRVSYAIPDEKEECLTINDRSISLTASRAARLDPAEALKYE